MEEGTSKPLIKTIAYFFMVVILVLKLRNLNFSFNNILIDHIELQLLLVIAVVELIDNFMIYIKNLRKYDRS